MPMFVLEGFSAEGRQTEPFDSTGMAIQDNTTSNLIFRNAVASNTGTAFEFIQS
ncbi:MAG: hypothetical protein ABI671_21720 [Burkholderiales bacterium]